MPPSSPSAIVKGEDATILSLRDRQGGSASSSPAPAGQPRPMGPAVNGVAVSAPTADRDVMMHVTYDGKSVLMHDDPATLLLEYAAELGSHHGADVVNVEALNLDGNVLTVGYLLNDSSELTAETTTAELDVSANEEAVAYMRDRIATLRNPPTAQPYTDDEPGPAYDI